MITYSVQVQSYPLNGQWFVNIGGLKFVKVRWERFHCRFKTSYFFFHFAWLLTYCVFWVCSSRSPPSSYFSATSSVFSAIFLVPISAPQRPYSFHSGVYPTEGLEVQAFSTFTTSKTSSLSSSTSDPSLHSPTACDTSQTGIA